MYKHFPFIKTKSKIFNQTLKIKGNNPLGLQHLDSPFIAFQGIGKFHTGSAPSLSFLIIDTRQFNQNTPMDGTLITSSGFLIWRGGGFTPYPEQLWPGWGGASSFKRGLLGEKGDHNKKIYCALIPNSEFKPLDF